MHGQCGAQWQQWRGPLESSAGNPQPEQRQGGPDGWSSAVLSEQPTTATGIPLKNSVLLSRLEWHMQDAWWQQVGVAGLCFLLYFTQICGQSRFQLLRAHCYCLACGFRDFVKLQRHPGNSTSLWEMKTNDDDASKVVLTADHYCSSDRPLCPADAHAHSSDVLAHFVTGPQANAVGAALPMGPRLFFSFFPTLSRCTVWQASSSTNETASLAHSFTAHLT